uniref:Putative nucleolar pre-rrna processing protein n=1 Tax=Amblyomma aureolatum TaxID=187763 RepID=A0A1E1XB26_9ACAR
MRRKGNRKIEDERFKHIATDPRFRGVPRSQRKVKIDNRFSAMFDDKRFKLKYVMDKRGRPIQSTTTEDLKKYYAVTSSESENEGDENVENTEEEGGNVEDVQESRSEHQDLKSRSTEGIPSAGEDAEDSEATEESEDGEEDNESLESADEEEEPERDPARGIGNIETSSEEDESSEDEAEGADDDAVAWGELDRDAPQSDHVSRRLALCNLDWDKLRAQDLFVLLDSFKPPGGVIYRVSVYPSEFGKERMAHEQVSGPTELVEAAHHDSKQASSSKVAEDDEEVDAKKKREALRQYQLSRLRYYYAIAECDSAETADHLYRELDGREYESSGTCLDLRFVPDDMTFTDEPSSVADGLPDPQSYKPLTFVTSALMSVNPELTWDEDDPRRSEAMQRAFKEDGDHDDLNVYLASSSSEDEEDNQEQGDDKQGMGKKASMEAQIQKYRNLLKSLDEGEKKADNDDDDVEMEVTWNPGLNKQVEDLVKKKQEQPEEKTPFQEFLEKRKEKRKLRRSLNKQGVQAEDSGDDKEDQDDTENSQPEQAFSDDDLPSDVDLGDDFFKRNAPLKTSKEGAKNKKKRKGVIEEDKAEDEETTKSKAELELLLMDEDNDGRHHFSLKKLLEENQAGQNKKRKRKAEREGKAAKQGKPDGDDFQVDLGDPRFSALYDSHHFNVDPTDSHFKKTKGMEALLAEKQKRRLAAPEKALPKAATASNTPRTLPASQEEPDFPLLPEPVVAPKPSRQSLSSLASSVKLKVQQMKNRNKKLPS